ncbi:hypothetical protein SCP_0607170 [Sparassis crispa]|uniref:Uncharacterized protein n=1 Tax=Sparassis crispa TaxID=139825 RepID=A0A401GR86_9APHY|nr:hypothetical protein SCP_0607050 [Sparassis crispa]XP_027615650.1 hypothetical protein SCP_0607170 [Sparassis crispa]GBE84725.1 hypothetical protein SCP_0607050 [Sparassis crispa]GBE84737.1 hypothetical protein SCP_0607170 [Sparassis crispa]
MNLRLCMGHGSDAVGGTNPLAVEVRLQSKHHAKLVEDVIHQAFAQLQLLGRQGLEPVGDSGHESDLRR